MSAMTVAGPSERSGQPDGQPVTVQREGQLRTHMLRFAVVGATTTVLHLGLFATLTLAVASQAANLLALVLATVVNTYLNRVWTFGRRAGSGNPAREQLQGLSVFLITWGATGGGLALVSALWPGASTSVQVLAIAACNVASTAARFVAMRYWIFAARAG